MSAMRRAVRWAWVIAAIGVGALSLAAVIGVVVRRPDPALAPALAQRQADSARGAYIAVLGDCAFCHTKGGGQPFAGGLFVTEPGVRGVAEPLFAG